MSLPPVKIKILENMLLNDGPTRAAQIAKDSGKEFPATMMHLLDLTRKGYALSPEKGLYAISEKGKRILGIPEINSENAKALLAESPRGKAFHFYMAVEKPLNLYACGLQDFLEKVQNVNVESLEFHVCRGDFESWFMCLGDVELGKKMALLKDKKFCGEELRQKLKAIVESRCTALSTMA